MAQPIYASPSVLSCSFFLLFFYFFAFFPFDFILLFFFLLLAVLQIFFLFLFLSSFFLQRSKFRVYETGYGTQNSSPASSRLPPRTQSAADLSASSLGVVFDDLFIPRRNRPCFVIAESLHLLAHSNRLAAIWISRFGGRDETWTWPNK